MSIEDKVRMLLDEVADEDSCFIIPTPFISRPSSTLPPPLLNVAVEDTFANSFMSVRAPERRRVLSARQTSDLLNRLYQVKTTPVEQPSAPPPQRTLMNPNSIRMTRGLEPIDVRSSKLVKAREKRLEQLVREKEMAERSAVTGHPEINCRSREIALRLTPEARQRIVEERKRILLEEQQMKENYEFRPKINPISYRVAQRRNFNSPSVVDRLVRDVDARKERHERDRVQHDRIVLAACRPVPFITPAAKSIFSKTTVPPVHQRLYPRPPQNEEPEDVNTSFVVPEPPVRRSSFVANSVSFSEFLHGYPRVSQESVFPNPSSHATNLSGVFALTRR